MGFHPHLRNCYWYCTPQQNNLSPTTYQVHGVIAYCMMTHWSVVPNYGPSVIGAERPALIPSSTLSLRYPWRVPSHSDSPAVTVNLDMNMCLREIRGGRSPRGFIFVMVSPLPCSGVMIYSKRPLTIPGRRYRLPGGVIVSALRSEGIRRSSN